MLGPAMINQSESMACFEKLNFATKFKDSQTSKYFGPFKELKLGKEITNKS